MEEEKGIFPTTGHEPEAQGEEGLGRIAIPHKDMEKHLAIFLASFQEGEKGFREKLGAFIGSKQSGNGNRVTLLAQDHRAYMTDAAWPEWPDANSMPNYYDWMPPNSSTL